MDRASHSLKMFQAGILGGYSACMTPGLQMKEISAHAHDCAFEYHLGSTVLSYRIENTRNIHKEHSQGTFTSNIAWKTISKIGSWAFFPCSETC